MGVSLFALTSCSKTTVSDAKEEYCQSLAKLSQAVANLQEISGNSTIKDLKQAQEQVRSAFADIKQAATKLENAKVDRLEEAQGDLQKAINDIPNQFTLIAARKSIADEIAVVITARQDLFTRSQCRSD